jgi:hypothetical protein
MNPISQFDVHPDAESLNGFVEHQLSEPERAQVMEHLASCSRCRRIVCLAQDAIPAGELRAPVTTGSERMEVRRKPWRFGRGFAWATAACGLLAVLAIFVSTRKGARPAEMAKTSPPLAVTSALNAPMPAAPAPAEKSPAPKPPADALQPAPRPSSPASGAIGGPRGREVGAQLASVPPPAELAAQSGFKAIRNANAGTESGDDLVKSFAAGGGNAPAQSPSMAAREGRFHGVASAPGPNALAAKTAPVMKNELAPQAASETETVSGYQAQLQTQTVGSAQLETIAPQAADTAAEEKKSGLAMLPSGLPVVSMVAAGRNIVAIDAVGSLFLSRDFERSWEPVARQWTGRAVKVRMAQTPGAPGALGSFASQSASPRAKASIGTPIPGAIFELVNDGNAVWTSADGKTWKAK